MSKDSPPLGVSDPEPAAFSTEPAAKRRSIADVEERLTQAIAAQTHIIEGADTDVKRATARLEAAFIRRDALQDALRIVQEKP